jgi:hypothetical protein
MKNFILFIFFASISHTGFSQDTVVIVGKKKNWRAEQRAEKILNRDKFVQQYSDSLNSYKSNNCTLPYFFTCDNFDQKFRGQFILGMHSPISLRKLIIDGINNYEILWCVNDSQDPRVHVKDTSKIRCLHCKIPFDQFSNHELVNFRLDEIMNEKHLGRN